MSPPNPPSPQDPFPQLPREGRRGCLFWGVTKHPVTQPHIPGPMPCCFWLGACVGCVFGGWECQKAFKRESRLCLEREQRAACTPFFLKLLPTLAREQPPKMLSPDFASSSWGVRLGLVLLLLLVGGPEGEAAQREEPPPCKEGRECLGYTVACQGSGYEGRHYLASSWVGTRVEGLAYLPSLVKGFWRLFRYIQGKNEQNATIPMTAPVLTRVRENSDSSGGEAFEVYFMLPEAFRKEPPKPTEEMVFLETFPQLQAYVRFFGGWMSDRVRRAQLAALDSDLRRDGRVALPGVHFTAGFNSPFELFDRRNEVWRLAEGALGCGGSGPEE